MLGDQGMNRKLRVMIGGLVLFLGVSMVSAAPATDNILSAVPADAWVAIEIKDLSKTSKALDDYAVKLGVEQPAMQRRISRMLGIGGQIEANKPLVVVVMNKQTYGSQPVAVIMSVKEYDNFAAGFKAKATETPGLMKGENEEIGQVYFTKKGPYVVMGPTEAIVNAVASSKQGVAAAMEAGSLKVQADSDVYVRANLQALGQFVKPLLMGIGAMMQMGAMGGMGGLGGEGGDATTQEGGNLQTQAQMQALGAIINAAVGFIDELGALDVGLKLNPDVILASTMLGFRSGQEMANVLALQKMTSKSLLTGLPGSGFTMAAGWQWQPRMTKFGEALLQANPGFTDPADIEKYKAIQKESAEMVTGTAVKLDTRASVTPGEPMIAFYAVMETKDAKKYLALSRQSMELQSKMKIQVKPGQEAKLQFKYEPDVMKVENISVNRYTVDIGKLLNMSGVGGEEMQQVKTFLTMILGDASDAVKVYDAAVTDKVAIMAFGAGPKEFENFVKVAKSGAAPLSVDPKLIQAGKLLAKERFMEGYLDVGKLISAVMAVVMGSEAGAGQEKPQTLPAIQTPLVGFTGVVEGPAIRVDAAVPLEVLVQASSLKSMVPTSMPAGGAEPKNPEISPK